jgi:hypothetical protein
MTGQVTLDLEFDDGIIREYVVAPIQVGNVDEFFLSPL